MRPSTRRLAYACAIPFAMAAVLSAAMWLLKRTPAAAPPPPVSGPALPPGRIDPVLAVASSSAALLAPDGEAWIWGYMPTPSPSVPPNQWDIPRRIAPGTNWVRVANGGQHLLLIRDDGTLWGMGGNWASQLGSTGVGANGIRGLIQISTETNWLDVAASLWASAGIQRDGSLWIWGDNAPTPANCPPTAFPGTNQWQAVALTQNAGYALRSDRTIWAWTNHVTVPVPGPTIFDDRPIWKAIAAHTDGLHALDTNGVLHFAVAEVLVQKRPGRRFLNRVAAAEGESFDRVLAPNNGFIARKSDGSWWAAGFDQHGRFGVNRTDSTYLPLTRLPWPLETRALSGADTTTAALLADGTLWFSGTRLGAISFRPATPVHAVHSILAEIGNGLHISRSGSRNQGSPVPARLWTWPNATNSAPSQP